jgi:catechol 2,3-dioxygenase-like lactoylglutathione lyase family enzyme
MKGAARSLVRTVRAMRPTVPAKDFDISQRFYVELGFEARKLTDRPVEMRLGVFSFILQNYYVREWADNFVIHLTVSDVSLWWNHIARLELPTRYGVKTRSPVAEGWATAAGLTDPSGVLWRIAELCPAPADPAYA